MKKNVWLFWFSDDRKDGELQHCVSTSKLKKKKSKKERESGEWKHKQAALEKEKKKEKRGRTTFQQSLRYNKDSSHTELFLTASVCYKKLLHSQFACT